MGEVEEKSMQVLKIQQELGEVCRCRVRHLEGEVEEKSMQMLKIQQELGEVCRCRVRHLYWGWTGKINTVGVTD